jgi:23S rRNA pseudouridine2604 synthase
MATLKLKKPTGPAKPQRAADRAPVRSTGLKKRPTLSQAQAERDAREARYQEQLRLRFGDQPPEAFKRRPASEGQHPPQRPLRPADREQARERGREGDRREMRNDRPPRRDDAARPPRRDQDNRAAPRRDERDTRNARPARPLPPARPVRAGANTGANTAFGGPARQGPTSPNAPKYPPTSRRSHRHDHDDDDDDHSKVHAEIPGSMRLSKRMSELGIASRREADEWIPKGWVRVDGKVVTELGSRVLPGQLISIEAKARDAQALKVTVLIHKPIGYVSGQAEDGYEPASVLVTPQNQWREDRSGVRFLQSHLRGLAPAGRLDIDSTGLLVLTQDGRIAKQLIGEDSEIEKEYLVRVQSQDGQPLPDDKLDLLRHGLELDGEPLRPAQVEWVNDDQLRFVLREGKKRQIRRMCEAVGLKVIGLKRVRIGQVMLGDLPPGAWRYLRGTERF